MKKNDLPWWRILSNEQKTNPIEWKTPYWNWCFLLRTMFLWLRKARNAYKHEHQHIKWLRKIDRSFNHFSPHASRIRLLKIIRSILWLLIRWLRWWFHVRWFRMSRRSSVQVSGIRKDNNRLVSVELTPSSIDRSSSDSKIE